MEHQISGKDHREEQPEQPRKEPFMHLQHLVASTSHAQKDRHLLHAISEQQKVKPREMNGITEKLKHQEQNRNNWSGMPQLVKRRTLHSHEGNGWTQPRPENEEIKPLERFNGGYIGVSSTAVKKATSSRGALATLCEGKLHSMNSRVRQVNRESGQTTNAAAFSSNSSTDSNINDSGNSSTESNSSNSSNSSCSNNSRSRLTSCAPWRVTLIVEAFDANVTGCPVCLRNSVVRDATTSQDGEFDREANGFAAAGPVECSTRHGSIPEINCRRKSRGHCSVSSAGSTTSIPELSRSSSRSRSINGKSKAGIWCCSCTQLWLEVQDLRGPGAPAALRLLSNRELLPRYLSPPILLPLHMRQLQFRLYRRQPRQQQHLLELSQEVEWVEQREPLGIRAILLPNAPSCVLSCTFGIAGCKSVGPASPSLYRQSLKLAAATSDQDWKWLRLRRPKIQFPLDECSPSHSQPLRSLYSTLSPVYRWLRLSARSCSREGAAALLGVYVHLLKGADCVRLVANDRFALTLYEP